MTETEARIAQLRTQQGELAQEMKQLGDDRRLSVAQLELACVERRIEGMCRQWQIYATASVLLEDVCGTFERERQPETLREASTFLNQLTNGKYTRIWTPLGTNQLKIDDADGKSLRLDVLSRGTREAVFIALRLSLAAAYARRGVMLPLVLDDVLVNFDQERAVYAARTLKTFAELGHQVLMFTCHQHIIDIFHRIDVEVRRLPPQGTPGRATVLLPQRAPDPILELEDEDLLEDENHTNSEPEQPIPLVLHQQVQPEEPPARVIEIPAEPQPIAPLVKPVEVRRPKAKKKLRPRIEYVTPRVRDEQVQEAIEEPRRAEPQPAAGIGWAWFEREPMEQLDDVEDALASIANQGSRDERRRDSNREISHSGPWWNER